MIQVGDIVKINENHQLSHHLRGVKGEIIKSLGANVFDVKILEGACKDRLYFFHTRMFTKIGSKWCIS